MAKEIERKFLIKDVSKLRHLLKSFCSGSKDIRQGYLSSDPVVRIRTIDDEAFITVKGKGTRVRQEFEYPIPFADARKLLRICKRRIWKNRYFFGRWEIDQFRDNHKGLWLAEYELKSEDEKMPPLPKWIGEEVTDDPKYANVNLAS